VHRALLVIGSGLVIGLVAAPAAGQDWPEFRGPTGQGTTAETGFPVEWSDARNVRWRVPVPGRGWSSPVVAGDRTWVTTAVDLKGRASLRLIGFDFETGREAVNVEVFTIWREEFSANAKNSNATPTPIVASDRVFVHFGASGTAAVSTDGRVLWKTRLPFVNEHGQGGSPALVGNLLVINCDGFDEAYVVALDAATGRTKWRRARRAPTSQAYSTPLAIRTPAGDQVVSVGASYTTGLDVATGRELWRVAYPGGFSNVPRPVFGHGLAFITTGFQQPSLLAIRVDGASGDVTRTHVAWRLDRGVPFTPSPILVGDELYVLNDQGIVQCLDARTGQTHWVQRLPAGGYSASPIAADGRVYFSSEDGVTTVIEAGRTFRRLAENRLAGAQLSSTAATRGSFLVRTDTHLYRIAAAGPSGGATADVRKPPATGAASVRTP
jgi:outer membrane protein assembly factor BamB